MSSRKKIFIVDDGHEVESFISQNLKEKYQIDHFQTGRDCLEALKKEQPKIIFIHLMIPGMDSLALCRNIRLQNSQKPFIVAFSNTSKISSLLKTCESSGVNQVLFSPHSKEQMETALLENTLA